MSTICVKQCAWLSAFRAAGGARTVRLNLLADGKDSVSQCGFLHNSGLLRFHVLKDPDRVHVDRPPLCLPL
ncbi:MAG: hypothetical protein PUF78_04155 [Lachnospiraceae bacterium]|nr:hypothetical protein [Lachnospiraceae bacterium]